MSLFRFLNTSVRAAIGHDTHMRELWKSADPLSSPVFIFPITILSSDIHLKYSVFFFSFGYYYYYCGYVFFSGIIILFRVFLFSDTFALLLLFFFCTRIFFSLRYFTVFLFPIRRLVYDKFSLRQMFSSFFPVVRRVFELFVTTDYRISNYLLTDIPIVLISLHLSSTVSLVNRVTRHQRVLPPVICQFLFI